MNRMNSKTIGVRVGKLLVAVTASIFVVSSVVNSQPNCANQIGASSNQYAPCSYCLQDDHGNWFRFYFIGSNGQSCQATAYSYPVTVDLQCGYYPQILMWWDQNGFEVAMCNSYPTPIINATCQEGYCNGTLGSPGSVDTYDLMTGSSCGDSQ